MELKIKTDKNQTQTWSKYNKKNCSKCIATCCTMPVEVSGSDLVRLGLCTFEELSFSHKDVAKKLLKKKIIKKFDSKNQIFVLSQMALGECLYLDLKTRKCTIYEKRPEVCRRFPTLVGSRLGYCPYIKNKNG